MQLLRRPEREPQHPAPSTRCAPCAARRSRSSPASRAQLYAPKLTLESTIRPPISETDLVSYLITGRPASEAMQLGQGGALQTGAGLLLERASRASSSGR